MARLGSFGFVVAMFLLVGCIPPAGTYGSYTASTASGSHRSGIYINGQELTAQDEALLESLLGQEVPPGRYYVDNHGMMGVEGQAPSVNLVALVQARRGASGGGSDSAGSSEEPFSMYSQDSAGRGSSIVSDGEGCTILSTPDGSLSTGC